MKKLMTVLLCVIFAISVIYHPVTALAVNGEHDCDSNADIVSSDVIDETAPPEEEIPCVPISEINLDDDLAFLADYGVIIPNEYLDVEDLNELIRGNVDYIRNNNYRPLLTNFKFVNFFKNQVAAATAEHDGVDIDSLRIDSGETTRYTLVDSTKYGSWKGYYISTNCYGYALGKKNLNEWPGYFGDDPIYEFHVRRYIMAGDIASVADLFADDLRALGYNVKQTTSAPSATTLSSSGNVVFCVRICKGDPRSDTDPGDFHFMRYNQTAKGWVHKPSDTHVLKYKYQNAGAKTWTNECIDDSGVTYGPGIYYDSDIYYFVCTPHSHIFEEVTSTGDTSVHYCRCILCGKVYSQAHRLNSSGSACTVCGRKPPFTSLKSVGGEGFEAALPQTNHEAFMRKLYPDNNDQ